MKKKILLILLAFTFFFGVQVVQAEEVNEIGNEGENAQAVLVENTDLPGANLDGINDTFEDDSNDLGEGNITEDVPTRDESDDTSSDDGGSDEGGTDEGDAPDHSKDLIINDDGTYTLELTVTGDSEKQVTKANVVIVLDTSESMNDSTGNTTTVYTPTTEYGNNTYGLIDGEYVPLERRGRGNNSTYWYNGVQYTGTRYTRQNHNQTRLEAAKEAVNSIAEALLSNNGEDGNPEDVVELALIDFNAHATIRITKTTSYEEFSAEVNALGTSNGTNWESALAAANSIDFGDTDKVYVIFVTDGNPSVRDSANGYDADWNDEYDAYVSWWDRDNTTRAYNAATDDAKAIVDANKELYTVGVYGNVDRMESLTEAAGAPASNYYSAEDTAAFQEALNSILNKIEMAGIGSVQITDGTTANVTATTGAISHLLVVDPESFLYYKGDKEADEWTPWTEAEGAPTATYEDGTVVWDLKSLGVLENGVTYKVTFRVWPSQDTMDLIADLKNHPEKYDQLDENIREYLVRTGTGSSAVYTLKTNTDAVLTFVDTRPGGTQNGSADYTNPDPVGTRATETLAISKKWENNLDERLKTPVTLTVLMDDDSWDSFKLDEDNDWSTNVFISVGIMTDDGNGNIEILTPGHDFSFGELGSDVYNWQLKSEIVHPMLINGVLTILYRYGTEAPTDVEGDYYKIGDYYYIVGEIGQNVVDLIAVNERRSYLELEKAVETVDGFSTFEDQLFEFTITITDPNEDDIWFSVKESKESGARYITVDDGLEVTGATKDANSNYYVATSGTPFTIKIKKGWNVRIINLLSNTSYEIVETLDNKFELVGTLLEVTTAEGTTPTEGTDLTVSGDIETTNTYYSIIYTNKIVGTEITVTKVWEDGDNAGETRPDSITVVLSNGEEAELNEDNDWTYTFTDLPLYDENEEKITYDIEEVEVEGYKSEKEGDQEEGFTITNTLVTEVTVTKVWEDGENAGETRPDSITVVLSNGDEAELNEENDWSYTFTDLPVYDENGEIEYDIEEVDVDNYVSVIMGDQYEGFEIYNILVTEVTVTKVWDDDDDERGLRPDSVTINLYANGEFFDSIELSEENNWTYTFEYLSVYDENGKIEYTVDEEEVPGYEASIEGDAENGYVITNITMIKKYGDGTGYTGFEGPTPETSDSLYTYIVGLLISLGSLVIFTYLYIKNRKALAV